VNLLKDSVQVAKDDKDVRSIMKHAFDHVSKNRDEVKKQLISIMLDLELECLGASADEKKAEVKSLAEQICEAMTNQLLKLIGHDNQMSFSACIMQMAMASFLEGPNNYEKMKEMSLEVFLSQRTLYKHQKPGARCK